MKLKCELLSIVIDKDTKENIITIKSKMGNMELLEQLGQNPLDVTFEKFSPKRTLRANAYFHELVGKLADARGITKAHQKNDLICSYGQYELLDDKPMVYTTQAPPEYIQELEHMHMKLCHVDVKGDRTFYSYIIYRGSKDYTSAEMCKLIDGTIAECRDEGLDVLTYDQLEYMKALWMQNG